MKKIFSYLILELFGLFLTRNLFYSALALVLFVVFVPKRRKNTVSLNYK